MTTVLEVLNRTTAFFEKHGIESPRLNAQHLLAHSLGKKRIELYLEFERLLGEPELAPLRELVRRRSQGEPLQHLLGTIEFGDHTFVSDKRALVPRPETEQLVEYLCDLNLPRAGRFLDVGTGSGVIVLSLAARFPEAELHATDVSADALALARENAERLNIPERVQFSEGYLLGNSTGTFDLIVANLPYVGWKDAAQLAPEVLHDPALALFGGENGDELIRELIAAAPSYLRRGGTLALEIGHDQSNGLSRFLDEQKFHDITAKKDYAGTLRFLFAQHG